jgi:hypothetical protein
MSDVNPADTRLINHKDDVIAAYDGAGQNMKAGIEVELAFMNGEEPITVPENKALKTATLSSEAGVALGDDWLRNEPTAETLEVNSFARGPDGILDVLDDVNSKIDVTLDAAQGLGFKRSYFQSLPHKTYKELLDNLMDIPRYQAFFGPPRTDMEAIAAYFSVCKSNQISVSYSDFDHLLGNIRRLYTLAPFLFLLTDNGSGFREGEAFSGHAGMAYRAALKCRGGVPDYVFTATSGTEYIDRHIDHVMNNPLYVYYNHEGELQRLDSGVWTNFNELRARELNTATNYYFSESVLWPDVKIAALKDANDAVTGHRYEARMFGVGIHQHQSAFIITTALAFNPAFAAAIDELLEKYGFALNTPDILREHVTAAYSAAKHHDGKFFDIPYGTGSMADFARDFADALETALSGSGLETHAQSIFDICRSGCTDAKLNRALFATLKDTLGYQTRYDHSVFENPSLSAASVIELDNPIKAACCG